MDAAQKSKHQVAPWAERLARFGYAAKGVVYIVIGVLAFRAAFNYGGGETTDSSGALREILQQPFGQILLFVIGLGLIGYVLWRLAQGLLDPENKGSDAKGIAKRAGYVLSGLAYGALVFTAFQLALGSGGGSGGGGGGGTQLWTARLLQVPFGRWLVALVGLAVIALAVNALYVAISGKFLEKLKTHEMGSGTESAVTVVGRLGLAARGVVLGVVGWLFIQAAYQANASQAGSTADALSTLESWGPWILGVIAVGVVAYGVYAIVQARYRQINIENAT